MHYLSYTNISTRINLLKFNLFLSFYIFILISNSCFPQYIIDFKVNDDTTTALQNNPVLAIDTKGNFIIAWEDKRDSLAYSKIYCQRYNSNGQKIGTNFVCSLEGCEYPSIAYRKDRSFIVVYNCYNLHRINMRIFDSSGTPISPIITVNDTINLYNTREITSVGIDSLGSIYVTMYYSKYNAFNYPDIYLQKFDSNGIKLGNNEKVNDDTGYSVMQEKPVITVRKDKSFIIAWRDFRTDGGGQGIYMQLYNSSGQKVGINTIVNDYISGPIDHDNPSISSDSIGNFTITWQDNRLTEINYQPWAQNFSFNGVKIGTNYRVDQGISLDKSHPKVAKRNDGKFIIGWIDPAFNTSTPFGRRYDNNYLPIGNQFALPKQFLNSLKSPFDFKLFGDKIITSWVDFRNGNADIYANILSFQNPDSIINNISHIKEIFSKDYELEQNYPNPFNSMTKIKYQIVKSEDRIQNSEVRIIVFDVLGKEIKTLINQEQLPGIYELKFDGSNLASGLYFYTLIVDGVRIDTKKLTLIK